MLHLIIEKQYRSLRGLQNMGITLGLMRKENLPLKIGYVLRY
uniref:Uncharacterized protein n=1 Tax=Arundo donax TaxID=35708 RepID=A0A0A9CH11_ARUDO